ncbi:MAG: PilZ domain-containing protein [Sphingobium sp.]
MDEPFKHPHALDYDATGNAADASDRREGERYVTVLKVGKAVVDGHDQLCLVRNMSRKGMKVILPHGVVPNQRVDIELRSDRVIRGTVRWTGDNMAGIEFDEPVEVEEILQHRQVRSVLRQHPRAPRFDRQEKVSVEHDGKYIEARMVNISLHGICVEIGYALRMGELAVIRIDGLPARSAHVQWSGKTMIGLHFELPLSFAELSRWLDEHV